MQEDLLQRAERIFQEAVELSGKAREDLLERHCGDDQALHDLVQRLLDAHESMGDFLEDAPVHRLSTGPDEGESLPSRIGKYEIIRVVGSGGMGIVYEARQDNPHRRVALKILHPALASPDWLRRFEREAEVLGYLHHPGIATVYEAGVAEVTVSGRPPARQPFLAMEFIKGLSLTRFAKTSRLDTRGRLELAARVCDAMQHAHERAVIHRDLKPGNILVQSDGQPKVLDFGIARATGADWQTLTIATASRHFMGTVPYSSPEQIGGERRDVDVRSDVYALGVILYELLSGRLPIETQDRSLPEAFRAIREDEPSRLSSFDSAFRGDIDAIVGKALSKEKERRYASAGEMAADIRRHLRSEPILARPPSTFYHLRRFARRNRALVGGVGATIVALIIGLVVATNFARREASQRRLAEAAFEQTQRAVVEARLDEAVALLAVRDFDAAARSLDTVPEGRRGWEWKHLRWRSGQYLAEIPSPGGVRMRAAVARRAPLLFTAGGDGVVRVWDLATLKIVKELFTGHQWISRLVAHPEGTLLLADISSRPPLTVYDTEDRYVVVWDVSSGRELWRRSAAPSLGVDAFSPDGSLLAVGLWDRREILLLDPHTGESREVITVPDNMAQGPTFSRDGRRLAYHNAGASGVVDRRTGRALRIPDFSLPLFTDDGNVLAGVRETRPKAVLMHLDTGETTGFPGAGGIPPLVGPDGSRLLIGVEDGTAVVRLGALDDAHPLGGKGSHPLSWSHDGKRLLTFRKDGSVRIWDSATDTRTFGITTHARASAETQSVYGSWNEVAALSPDGRYLATGGWQFVTLRTLSTGAEIWNAYGLEPFPTVLAFSRDGQRLAVAGQDSPVTIVDTASGATDRVLPRAGGQLAGLVWSRDGDRLVVASAEGGIRILDARNGSVVGELEGPSGQIRRLVSCPEGTRVAAAGRFVAPADSARSGGVLPGVVAWDLSDDSVLGVFRAGSGEIDAVTFDAGCRRIAAVTSAGEMTVWDVASDERFAAVVEEGVVLQSVAFAPDGERIVAGADDGKLWFWDARTYERTVTLQAELFSALFVRFSPDGSTLIAVGGDGVVLLETGPPPVGLAARALTHEALRLVNTLYNELTFAEDVTRRLQADHDLPDDVRAEALDQVRIRGDHIGWLNSDVVLGYRNKVLPPEERRLILRKIELVNRLWPDHPEYVANLGKSQYRAGMYQRALASLRRARELYRDSGQDLRPEDWAFITMAQWQLGEKQDAGETMQHLKALMADLHDEAKPWNRLFYEEAMSLIGVAP
jgi:serine/threonine protein kinase/WD40 repeat protein